jgi:glycosyltransferase involved in cell wall biosynthesis
MGGTELLQNRLYDGSVPRALLEQFQIIFSRVRDLDDTKYRILYLHDLPGDPESEHLKNGGWDKFHLLVFVSNWQQQAYINYYGIPWSKCFVIPNSVIPLAPSKNSEDGKIKLIYTSTPHRGLDILYSVFDALSKKYDNIELDVYSSFKLYGWEERDAQFQPLFDALNEHPKINYFGTATNDEVRAAVSNAQIFAYPSTWPETSCLCLIEAMSAGLLCVHPNYAALPETAMNLTRMYAWNEEPNVHATALYQILDMSIPQFKDDYDFLGLRTQGILANDVYNWHRRANDWTALLNGIVNSNMSKELPKASFNYSAS